MSTFLQNCFDFSSHIVYLMIYHNARFCPRAARALEMRARAKRAIARLENRGTGRSGHWILGGRAGKSGHGHVVQNTQNNL